LRKMVNLQFEESLINQYKDLIHQAIQESETEHKTQLNIGKLNSKLNIIIKAASYDGLPEDMVHGLIDQAIPTTRAA
jgi:hypothetical protein